MKTLLLLTLLSSLAYADQSQDSFVSGFAQGLNNALQSKAGYYPQQYQIPYNEGLSREELEQWIMQQDMLRNQQEQIWLQRQQIQQDQNKDAWWNK